MTRLYILHWRTLQSYVTNLLKNSTHKLKWAKIQKSFNEISTFGCHKTKIWNIATSQILFLMFNANWAVLKFNKSWPIRHSSFISVAKLKWRLKCVHCNSLIARVVSAMQHKSPFVRASAVSPHLLLCPLPLNHVTFDRRHTSPA